MEIQKRIKQPETKPSFIELNLVLTTISNFMDNPNKHELAIFNVIFEELLHMKFAFLPINDIITLMNKKGKL